MDMILIVVRMCRPLFVTQFHSDLVLASSLHPRFLTSHAAQRLPLRVKEARSPKLALRALFPNASAVAGVSAPIRSTALPKPSRVGGTIERRTKRTMKTYGKGVKNEEVAERHGSPECLTAKMEHAMKEKIRVRTRGALGSLLEFNCEKNMFHPDAKSGPCVDRDRGRT